MPYIASLTAKPNSGSAGSTIPPSTSAIIRTTAWNSAGPRLLVSWFCAQVLLPVALSSDRLLVALDVGVIDSDRLWLTLSDSVEQRAVDCWWPAAPTPCWQCSRAFNGRTTTTETDRQPEIIYSASQKISPTPPNVFWNLFFQFLSDILHAHSAFKSTANYNVFFNYSLIWQSYTILSVITYRIFAFYLKAHCTDFIATQSRNGHQINQTSIHLTNVSGVQGPKTNLVHSKAVRKPLHGNHFYARQQELL